MRDYNFFEAYHKKKGLDINVKSPVFLGIVVILLILAFSVGLLIQNVILAARLTSTVIELSNVQATEEYQKAIVLQNSISSMTEYDQNAGSALGRIQMGKVLNTEFLKKLSDVLPSTANIQTINLTRTTATLYINVPNQKAAAELVGNLDKSGLFLQTSLVSVTKDESTGAYVALINGIVKAGENE